MSDRLKLAFEEAAKLPEEERNDFADFLLANLKDAQEWDRQFAKSGDKLSLLAEEARREYRSGKTEPLEDIL